MSMLSSHGSSRRKSFGRSCHILRNTYGASKNAESFRSAYNLGRAASAGTCMRFTAGCNSGRVAVPRSRRHAGREYRRSINFTDLVASASARDGNFVRSPLQDLVAFTEPECPVRRAVRGRSPAPTPLSSNHDCPRHDHALRQRSRALPLVPLPPASRSRPPGALPLFKRRVPSLHIGIDQYCFSKKD
jgi:hypothetical protein